MARDLQAQFEAEGVVMLRGAFGREDAAFLRDMIWRQVEATTPVRRADAASWRSEANFGLRVVEARDAWAAVHRSAALNAALDAVFGAGQWHPPGPPQVLLTFPTPDPWRWPSGWHIDFGWDEPTFPVQAVKVFALLDAVDEEGGGTLLLRGSHRLVERLARSHGAPIDPWDRNVRPLDAVPQLAHVLDGSATRSSLGERVDVDGLELRPMEITGGAGDIVVAHIQVFHAPAPNATERPRQMIGNAVRRRGLGT